MIRSLSRLSSFYSTSSSKSSLKQLPFTSIRGDGGGGRTKGAYSRGNNRHVIVDNNATHSPDSDASHTPFHLRHPHHKSYFERLRRKEPGPDRDKLLWVRFHGLSGWEKLEFLSALQQKTFILEAFAVYRVKR